ncbi:DUF4214 domain-containing protein [Polynucleobacter asymbioticus]|jgi:hypothetical protein|uniref:DUF4214 domain-containing protein n=1 Tax=Polynucleobacter asymbioticus TaxID=576611 RepID=A0AAC9IQF7_9BURK|nr:DUF4214 domain-containing protein [Polynucleobacter asymbioticus]APB98165.1 hypothetical protein A4F89_01850 [Polynucleobacter asymbioticus]APC00451.1 hypothetical protein AOC25_01855 [Polynucleobacter asymbioticus]
MTTPITPAIQTEVANNYIAIFGRNPDPEGFGYWTNALANENNSAQAQQNLTLGFSASPEFQAAYNGLTTTQAVTQFYEFILNRAPDPSGLQYWTGVVNSYISQGFSVSQAYALAAVNLITVAAANTGTQDQALILNKEAAAVAAGTASTYTLTTHTDIATAVTFNGTFGAVLGGDLPTLNGTDQLTGGSVGGNTLNIIDAYGTGTDIMPAGLILNNIQTVHLTTAGNAGQTSFSTNTGNNTFNTSTFASVTATVVDSQGGDGYAYVYGTAGSGGDQVQASNNSSITVNHSNVNGSVTTYGGNDVTVNTNGSGGVVVEGYQNGSSQTLPTGHVTVNANGNLPGSANVAVFGGHQVDVTIAQASATGDIVIGNVLGSQSTGFLNPTGNVTVTDNANDFATGNVNSVQIAGGVNVQVTAKGDSIVVGKSEFSSTPGVGSAASDVPSGTVVISDLQAYTYDNLTGSGNTQWTGGDIAVYGGTNVSVTTNTGGQVQIGANNGSLTNALPSGTITLVDQASDKLGSFNIGQYNDPMGGPNIMGGTTVNATLAGTAVYIGVDGADNAPYTNTALNPTGHVTVTETVNSSQSIYVDGGNGITVSAKGQSVALGTFTGVNGAVSVTQDSVYSGNALGSSNASSSVIVDGGTTVNVTTTGGDVFVGGAYDDHQGNDPSGDQVTHVASGAVVIRDKFSGADSANADSIQVLGGTTVNITVDNSTSGDISVGADPTISSNGISLKNGNLDPTGNVTITNAVTHNDTTTYGTSHTDVIMNGGTTATITGGQVHQIVDAQQLLQNLGPNAGQAVGTSHLTTVVLDGVSSTDDGTLIDSGVLSSITIENSGANGQASTYIKTDPMGSLAASSAGPLSVVLLNNGQSDISWNSDARIDDNTTTAVTITNTGSSGDYFGLHGTNIATTTFNNAANLTGYLQASETNAITYTGAGNLDYQLTSVMGSFADNGSGNVTLNEHYAIGNVTDTNTTGSLDLFSRNGMGNFTQTGNASGDVSLNAGNPYDYNDASIGDVTTTTTGAVEIHTYGSWSSGNIGNVSDSHASSISVSTDGYYSGGNIGNFSETGNGSVTINISGGNLASFSDTGTGAVDLTVAGNVGGNIVNHSAATSSYDIGGSLSGSFTNDGSGDLHLAVNNGIGNIIDNSTAADTTFSIWLSDTAGSFTDAGKDNVVFIEESAQYLTGSVIDTSSGTLDLGDVSATTSLTAITATGATGAVTVTLDASKTSFAGGSGNDSVTLTSSTLTKTISGGAGNNTLYVDFEQTNNTLLQSSGGKVSGFSTLVINTSTTVVDTGTAPGDTGGPSGYVWNSGSVGPAQVDTVTITANPVTNNAYSIQLGNGAIVTFSASSNITTEAQVASGLQALVAVTYGSTYTVSAASGNSFTITSNTAGNAGAFVLSTTGSTGTFTALQTTSPANVGVDPYYDAAGFSNLVVTQPSAAAPNNDHYVDLAVYNFVNVASGTTLTLAETQSYESAPIPPAVAVNYILANSSGANDSLPIVVGVDGEAGTFVTLNAIYTYGVEHISIDSLGNLSTIDFNGPIPGGNIMAISDAALKTITITGDSATVVLLGDYAAKHWLTEADSNVTTVDASGSSGDVVLGGGGLSQGDTGFAWKADAAHTITGGSGMLYGTGGYNSDDADTWIAGSGGFNLNLGYGGSYNTVGDSYSANPVATVGTSSAGATYIGTNDTGSSHVNLTAASGVSNTIYAADYVQADLTSGGITGFKVVGSNLADFVTTGSGGPGAGNYGVALHNTSGPVTVGDLDVNHMALSFDPSGTLTTLLANLTYTSSNGLITFAATNGHQLSNYTDSQLVEAAELIVSYSSLGGEGGGPDTAMFTSHGNTFVVKSNYVTDSSIGSTAGTIAVGGLVQTVNYGNLNITDGLHVNQYGESSISVSVNGHSIQVNFFGGNGNGGSTYSAADVATAIANVWGTSNGVTAVVAAGDTGSTVVTFEASSLNTLGGQNIGLNAQGTSVTGTTTNEVISTDNANTVVELIGTDVAKSFNQIWQGGSTALRDHNVLYDQNAFDNAGGTAAAVTINATGYSLADGTVGTTSTVITNLGGSSEVDLTAVSNSLGAISTTQVAGSAIAFYLSASDSANFSGSLAVSGDWYTYITNTNGTYTLELTSLTDVTNTLTELELGTTGGLVKIDSIVGTALTSILGDNNDAYQLGTTTALSQNGLSITLGSNSSDEVYTSGNMDVITIGSGNVAVGASGSANTISIGGGALASITANGASDTITSGGDVHDITANGNLDVITVTSDVNSGGLIANGNTDIITVDGAVHGSLTAAGNNDVINVTGVVADDSGKVAVINGNNDVINLGGVDTSLTANGDHVQIHITSTYGANEIIAAGSGDTITVGTVVDGVTTVGADVGTLTVGGTVNDNFANTIIVTGSVDTLVSGNTGDQITIDGELNTGTINGAGTHISVGDGWNHLTATGAGDTIVSDYYIGYITANGNNDVVTINGDVYNSSFSSDDKSSTINGNNDAITVTGALLHGDGIGHAATLTANGNNDSISIATGNGTLIANGTNDTITVGGTVSVHASGTGDTFNLTGNVTVDGGLGLDSTHYAVANNSAISVTGSEIAPVVYITGDTNITVASITSSNSLELVLNNATKETTAMAVSNSSSNQVNVSSAGSLLDAQNLAAAVAAAADPTGGNKIAAHTGVVDWFQYGGNTYVVEAINSTGTAAAHTSFGVNDVLITVVGLHDLSSSTLSGGHLVISA